MHRNFFTAKIFRPSSFARLGMNPVCIESTLSPPVHSTRLHRMHSVLLCPTLSYSVCTASSKMTQPARGSFWPLIPDLVKAPGVGGILTIIRRHADACGCTDCLRGLLLTLLG
jgi:hypothetical protein